MLHERRLESIIMIPILVKKIFFIMFTVFSIQKSTERGISPI